jgi:hypothetical protein
MEQFGDYAYYYNSFYKDKGSGRWYEQTNSFMQARNL